MWQMRGREHNASPLSLKGLPGPTTGCNDAHAPTSPCPCTHRCLPHRHAPCAGLPPACTVSFFFFLLTSSFVVPVTTLSPPPLPTDTRPSSPSRASHHHHETTRGTT